MAHKVKWLGHATFSITTDRGKDILIDPWLKDNPVIPEDARNMDEADLVLITHDHFDHMGNLDQLKEVGTLFGQPEIIQKAKEMTDLKDEQMVNGGGGMNIGGTATACGIKVTMVEAHHSSDAGSPAGFFITLEDGKTIYHAGDTGIFANMEIYGELYTPDLALLPIGDVFTMDPLQAAKAVELLKPRTVIPMHYQTFPILTQDSVKFAELVKQKAPKVEVVPIKPGETYNLT